MKKALKYIISITLFALIIGCSEESTGTTEESSPEQTFQVGEEEIVLKPKMVLEDQLSMLIPEEFDIMAEEIAQIKYPSERRPPIIYTNEASSINVVLNYLEDEIKNKQIEEFHTSVEGMFQNLYPSAEWLSAEVIQNDAGKNIGVLELVTPTIDGEVYNLIHFMELDGRVLMVSFNCTDQEMEDWKPIGKEIMNSITESE